MRGLPPSGPPVRKHDDGRGFREEPEAPTGPMTPFRDNFDSQVIVRVLVEREEARIVESNGFALGRTEKPGR